MSWPSSYLVFDFETTGLSPERHHIIQVGLCDVLEGRVIRQSGWLVNQDVEVPPNVTEIHGITTGDIRTRGVSPEKSLRVLLKAMRDAPTCLGHNIHRFDVPFLLAECRRLGMDPPDCRDYLDTAALYKGRKLGIRKDPAESHQQYAVRILSLRVRGLRYSVPTCLDELGINIDSATLHDATHDSYATHLILQALQKVV